MTVFFQHVEFIILLLKIMVVIDISICKDCDFSIIRMRFWMVTYLRGEQNMGTIAWSWTQLARSDLTVMVIGGWRQVFHRGWSLYCGLCLEDGSLFRVQGMASRIKPFWDSIKNPLRFFGGHFPYPWIIVVNSNTLDSSSLSACPENQ